MVLSTAQKKGGDERAGLLSNDKSCFMEDAAACIDHYRALFLCAFHHRLTVCKGIFYTRIIHILKPQGSYISSVSCCASYRRMSFS